MSMMDDVLERLKSDKEELNKWVGVYIGVLAVLLAICSVGGGNATKDATRANIDAADTWAFYQAKGVRRTSFMIAADELELTLTTQPALAGPARKAVEDKVQAYRAEADRLKSDPKEGIDQLLARARTLEAERDVALRRDPYFDWSQALIQIAIVLASVHLIIGNLLLLGLSGGLAGLGILLMLDGYTLLVSLPFLG
jgi:nitroreductase